MSRKILLGSDGSDDALHAAHLASFIARSVPSEVIVLNVFNLGAAIAFLTPDAISCSEVLIESGRLAQKDILARTRERLVQEGIPCRTRAETGHPVEITLQIATEEKADVIVLGSHGRSGFQTLLLGSVADSVAHHSPCPVLVVRGKTDTIGKILVAVDGSEGSYKALRAADELAKPLGARISVLHVQDPTKSSPDPASTGTPKKDPLTEHVRSLQQASGVEYPIFQETGDAVEEITTFATANNIDLIVMGSHGYGAFQRLLLGSVSYGVLHHATCPVLIVR